MRRPVFTTAPALDSCFRRNGCGQGRDAAPRPLTTPAKAGVYRFLLRGASYSPPPRPWIPAFAGMVAVRGGTRPRAHRPPLRKQGSTASYYAAPRIHHRPGPGFLLSQEWLRSGAGRGPRPLTTPAKAGVYRLILCGAPYSPLPRPWIPAFAGMVASGLTLTLPGQASLALHGGAVRAAPAGTSADCAVSRKPCPPAAPLRCVSGSWGSPSATGPSGRTRR